MREPSVSFRKSKSFCTTHIANGEGEKHACYRTKMANVHAHSSLSDGALLRGLERLVIKDRKLDTEILRHIGEVDRRKLFREHACSSMFAFCTERLGMSEDVAFRRIRVARVARALPAVFEQLESGRIHLSGLALLAPHLTRENATDVLDQAAGKSKRQIEVLVRELAPIPDVAASIRKAPAPRALTAVSASPAPGRAIPPEPASIQALPSAPPLGPAKIAPLSPARYHVSFTATEELKRNLDKARELAAPVAYGHTPCRAERPLWGDRTYQTRTWLRIASRANALGWARARGCCRGRR